MPSKIGVFGLISPPRHFARHDGLRIYPAGAIMNITKRDFLKISAAGLACIPNALSAQTDMRTVTARVADIQLLPDNYGITQIWGFDGIAPGPEIRIKQGARVQRHTGMGAYAHGGVQVWVLSGKAARGKGFKKKEQLDDKLTKRKT